MSLEIMNLIEAFAPMFQRRTWDKAQEMMKGAILTSWKRVVSSILQVLGKSQADSCCTGIVGGLSDLV